MRKEQKEAIEQFQFRCDLTSKQVDEVAKLLACTFGPMLLASLIEHGLLVFRRQKRKKKKK